MTSMAHTNGRGSKQALVRDEILGMLDELRSATRCRPSGGWRASWACRARRCAP